MYTHIQLFLSDAFVRTNCEIWALGYFWGAFVFRLKTMQLLFLSWFFSGEDWLVISSKKNAPVSSTAEAKNWSGNGASSCCDYNTFHWDWCQQESQAKVLQIDNLLFLRTQSSELGYIIYGVSLSSRGCPSTILASWCGKVPLLSFKAIQTLLRKGAIKLSKLQVKMPNKASMKLEMLWQACR